MIRTLSKKLTKAIVSISIIITYIAKAKNALQSLIGFNDGSKNMNQVIKASKLIDIELDKCSNSQFDTRHEEQKEQLTTSLDQTIEVPSEFYYSRIVDNMKPRNTGCAFRSTRLKQIHANLSIIERMLFEDNRSMKYVAKWLRIPAKDIIGTLRQYFEALIRSKKLNDQKQQIKYKRMLIAKDQIASFIRSRAGR